MAKAGPFVILGYDGCGYYDRAVKAANEAGVECWPTKFATREQFLAHIISTGGMAAKIKLHRTSPVVLELAVQSLPAARTSRTVLDADTLSSAAFIGGCDELLERLGVFSDVDVGPPSRPPSEVFKYFESLQQTNHFVLWILWRE